MVINDPSLLLSVHSEWLCNYNTQEEAILAVLNLNKLAESGNTVMDCNFYVYHTGDPFIDSTECRGMTGLYRKRVTYCRTCGHCREDHEYIPAWKSPCGSSNN